jgi:tetratricopeptide (TPR) repeat protein
VTGVERLLAVTAFGPSFDFAMRALLVLAVLSWATPVSAQQLSADEIIARHLEARGGAARLKAMTTVVYRNGTYREGSYSGSGRAFMAMARPYYKIVGDPADSTSSFREGYDGSAWEWFKAPGFVVRTVGAANAAIRHNLDPDGALSDYRAKGSSIERVADASVGGRRAYGIRLTLSDGYETLILIDAETFLITASRKTAPVHAFGAPVTSEERYGDYRTIDGIRFPFRYTETEISSGRELSSMQWGVIEVNRELPRDWFSPPPFQRTALQQLLEQLYVQRSDTSALGWSYRAFRRAHQDIETRAGIEAIGFQILKMGDHAGAVALLSMNARDYPQSSSAAFGLGRAHATAGDTLRARDAFERALRLDPQNRTAAAALAALGRPPGD